MPLGDINNVDRHVQIKSFVSNLQRILMIQFHTSSTTTLFHAQVAGLWMPSAVILVACAFGIDRLDFIAAIPAYTQILTLPFFAEQILAHARGPAG